MRFALAIALKDLRQQLRNRTAVLVALVVPLVLTALMGFALGGSEGLRMRLAIADLDGTETSRRFRSYAEEARFRGIVFVEAVAGRGAAEARVAASEAEVAVVLPRGLARALAAGASIDVDVIAGDRNPYAAHMAESMARDFLHRARGATAGAPVVVPRSPGGRMRTIDFFGPSMAVLFLTFAVLTGVRALQAEVDDGTIARLRAAPCSPVAVVAGKFAALLLVGLVQMGVMIAATSLLFGTRWGNPLPVAVLAVASALMAIGLAAFFVSLAESTEQGQGIATIAIFLLAAIGGQFLPPQGLPDVFDTLNRLTPNGQAFRGFTDLAAAGAEGSLRTVREPLLVTLGVGLGGIGVAALRARGALQRVSA